MLCLKKNWYQLLVAFSVNVWPLDLTIFLATYKLKNIPSSDIVKNDSF